MSLDKRLAAVVSLAQARRAASACRHEDINSTVRQCQASPSQIFVVPVRYALSEEPASHPAFQPGVHCKSHPMAARLLRTGFIYLWQGSGPLQRFAVAKNNLLRSQALDEDDTVVHAGTQSGIALHKHQEAWMLYSEIPLNSASCAQLIEPERRAKHMRRLDLRQVANTLQAPHCAPLKASLEGAVNSTSRAVELVAALSIENQANAEQALSRGPRFEAHRCVQYRLEFYGIKAH
ncbi:toxin VasX [Pseudomonas sp. SIMBA_077]